MGAALRGGRPGHRAVAGLPVELQPLRAGRTGLLAAAACAACCAPPIIAALGVTAGLAVTAGAFLGLAAAVAVVALGAGWVVARARRSTGTAGAACSSDGAASPTAVAVAPPTRRAVRSRSGSPIA